MILAQNSWQGQSDEDELAWQAATANMEAFGNVARALDHATCRAPHTLYEDMTTDKESRLLNLLHLGAATSSPTQLSGELAHAMQYVHANKALDISSRSRESVQSVATCASSTPEIEPVSEYCSTPTSYWSEETTPYSDSIGYDCQSGYDSGTMYRDSVSYTHETTLAVDTPLSDAWFDLDWMSQPMYDDECEAQFPYGWGNSNLHEVERPGPSFYRSGNFEHCTQADSVEKCRGGDRFAKEHDYLQHTHGRFADKFDPSARHAAYWGQRDAYGYPTYGGPHNGHRGTWHEAENSYSDGNSFFGSCFDQPQ